MAKEKGDCSFSISINKLLQPWRFPVLGMLNDEADCMSSAHQHQAARQVLLNFGKQKRPDSHFKC